MNYPLSAVHTSACCQTTAVLCAYVRYDVLGLLAMCRCQSRIDFADYYRLYAHQSCDFGFDFVCFNLQSLTSLLTRV